MRLTVRTCTVRGGTAGLPGASYRSGWARWLTFARKPGNWRLFQTLGDAKGNKVSSLTELIR